MFYYKSSIVSANTPLVDAPLGGASLRFRSVLDVIDFIVCTSLRMTFFLHTMVLVFSRLL